MENQLMGLFLLQYKEETEAQNNNNLSLRICIFLGGDRELCKVNLCLNCKHSQKYDKNKHMTLDIQVNRVPVPHCEIW
jgi:hypothetical protein